MFASFDSRSTSRRLTVMQSARGLTLVEVLIAMSIMTLIAGTLGTLARAVQMSSEYTEGHAAATQHARVSIERIARAINQATASESFPGTAVFAETVSGFRFPDTLVVWRPSGTPANPTGRPLFSELVVFCPDPADLSLLLKITATTETRTVPALTSSATWTTELTALKNSATAKKVLLSDLVRVSSTSSGGSQRGNLRFESRLRPSATEWAGYRGGTTAWEDLSWVQGIYGSQTGLAQNWVRIELQMVPGSAASNVSDQQVLPFFGSGAVYYQLQK